MKKLILTSIAIVVAATLFAQTNAKVRSDETSQPEIDNLSGLKPDVGTLEQSAAVGLSDGQSNTGTPGYNSDDYTIAAFSKDLNGYNKDVTIATAEVYPNPAKDFVTVSTEVSSGTITILNLLGQPLFTEQIQSNITSLNISALTQGIYFISLQSGSEKIVKKLTVNN